MSSPSTALDYPDERYGFFLLECLAAQTPAHLVGSESEPFFEVAKPRAGAKHHVVHDPSGLPRVVEHLSYHLADQEIHDADIEKLGVAQQASDDRKFSRYLDGRIGLERSRSVQHAIDLPARAEELRQLLRIEILLRHRQSLALVDRSIHFV